MSMLRYVRVCLLLLAAGLLCFGAASNPSPSSASAAKLASVETSSVALTGCPVSLIKTEQVGTNFYVWFKNQVTPSGTTGTDGSIILPNPEGWVEVKYFIGIPSSQSYYINNVDHAGMGMTSPKLIAVGTSLEVTGTEIRPGERVTLSCDATLTSKPFTVVVDKETITYPPTTTPPTAVHVDHEVWVSSLTGTLSRYATTSTSVDSRKMYGVPNVQGQPVGLDPNSPSRPVNFSSWDFKGGLFSGYVDPLTMDQSGKSRVQIYGVSMPTVSHSVYANIVFSVLGDSRYGGVSDLSAWGVASSDAFFGQTRATVTWDTRWTTHNGATGSLGRPPVAGLENISFVSGTSMPKRFVIESANETALVSGWTYFASDLYIASHPGLVDPQVHIFIIDSGTPDPITLAGPYSYADTSI